MPLKSVALTDEEKREHEGPTLISSGPEYPYGLRLFLDGSTVKKLGMDEMPEAGTKKTLVATVRVERISQMQENEGEKEVNIVLQITEMDLREQISKRDLASIYEAS